MSLPQSYYLNFADFFNASESASTEEGRKLMDRMAALDGAIRKDVIQQKILNFRSSIIRIGGEVSKVHIAPPATLAEVEYVEKKIGSKLPESIREFSLQISGSIEFHWFLPDKFDLPQEFDEIFSGGFSYSLFEIPEREKGRANWQKECFPDPDDSYDVIWHNKIGLIHVPNGDYIAANSDGQIIYLSNADGKGHGVKMANSFAALLDQWVPLGCPGPEDWQWLPFAGAAGISCDSESAKKWLAIFD